MRAAYYESVGPAFDVIQVGERPAPLPQAGEVRIRVHSSGVNPSDVKARAGARGALAYPYVIPRSGGAGAGVDRIVEVEFGGNLAVSTQVLKVGGVIAAYGSAAVSTPPLPFYPMMFNHTTVQMLLVYLLTPLRRQRACGLINEALEAGILKNSIGARFALADTAQAHVAVEIGSVIGNVVVTVS